MRWRQTEQRWLCCHILENLYEKKKKKKSQELINNASFNANDRHFKNEYTGKKKKKRTEQYMYNFFSNLHTHLV